MRQFNVFALLCKVIPIIVFASACATAPKSMKNDLVYTHKKMASDHTRKKELWSALREWEIVLTLYPDDKEAKKQIKDLKDTIVAKLLKSARADIKKQNMEEARRKLLSILFLDPNNEGALHYLKPNAPHFDIHQVKKGESLSKIAEKYYGDKNKLYLIVHYNPWINFSKIDVGERLLIPLVSLKKMGKIQKERQKRKKRDAREERERNAREERERNAREERERNAREERERNAREEHESKERVEEAPAGREESVEFHYQEGSKYFQEGNYSKAEGEWRKSLEIGPDHGPSKRGLSHIKQRIEEHYQNGLNYFQVQNISLAIEEWEKVFNYDPQFQNIGQHLEKAYKMQESLEAIKKSTQ